jgi:hypothetical protein
MLSEKASKAYYEYHYKYFQMLQLDNVSDSSTRWLWKSPTHTLFINSLMEIYPDARLIITHRHPFEVIPSFAKMYASYLRAKLTPGTLTMREIGRVATTICKTMINRMEAAGFFIGNNPKLIHIHYSNLINNPISCVKAIYDQYGLLINAELSESFQAQLKWNPKGEYGRMSYNLDEFELNKNEIQTEFATYIRWLDTLETHPRSN